MILGLAERVAEDDLARLEFHHVIFALAHQAVQFLGDLLALAARHAPQELREARRHAVDAAVDGL